jgi:hypothetical protein
MRVRTFTQPDVTAHSKFKKRGPNYNYAQTLINVNLEFRTTITTPVKLQLSQFRAENLA